MYKIKNEIVILFGIVNFFLKIVWVYWNKLKIFLLNILLFIFRDF